MKNFINKVKQDINEKTSGPPVVKGKAVEVFVLRVLLAILCYILIDRFILPIKLWQFAAVDMIIQAAEYIVYIVKKK